MSQNDYQYAHANPVSNTVTKVGNCFVVGTEILTVDGIKSIEDIRVFSQK
ncbi:hypothetical protein [Microcoleus sp.]